MSTIDPVPPVRSIVLRDVSVSLGGRRILDSLDLTVWRREIVALVGSSGSGKSTTLRTVAGLVEADSGDVHSVGSPSVVFQEPRLLPWQSVRRNVEHGLHRLDLDPAERDARSRAILAEVGLAGREEDWPAALSGGQTQRVALARGLVGEPAILLLDEPFSALDALTRRTMHALLLELWNRHDVGILLVTHDIDEAVGLADRVLVLDEGRIAHAEDIETPRDALTAESRQAHRERLLAALGVAEKETAA